MADLNSNSTYICVSYLISPKLNLLYIEINTLLVAYRDKEESLGEREMEKKKAMRESL